MPRVRPRWRMTAGFPFPLFLLSCRTTDPVAPPLELEANSTAAVDLLGRAEVIADLDGDGAATLVVSIDGGDTFAGRVLEAWHRAPGRGTSPDVRVAAAREDFSAFGEVWSGGADATGDGVADVAVTAAGMTSLEQPAYLLSGALLDEGLLSPAEVSTATFTGFNLGWGSGGVSPTSRRPIGDFDGDGVGDVALIDYEGHLALFRGPLAGEYELGDADAVATSIDPNSVLSGDLDGDGYADLVVLPNRADEDPTTRIFPGPSLPEDVDDTFATLEDTIPVCGYADGLGFAGTLSNIDDDPAVELLLAGPHYADRTDCAPRDTHAVYVWLDAPSGHVDEGSAALRVDGDRGSGFGEALVGADFDGDGSNELAVLSLTSLHIFDDLLGRPGEGDADLTFEHDEAELWSLGLAAGDLDGDGADDLVVSETDQAWVLSGKVVAPRD